MRNQLALKLSTKIIVTFIVASVVIFNFIAYSIDKIIQDNSYEAEKEKAVLLLDSISPEVAMNVYLGLYNDAVAKSKNLFRYDAVLAVKVVSANGTVLGENFREKLDKTRLASAIKTHIDIKDQVTGQPLAIVEMDYSNENYLKLISSFRQAVVAIVAVSVVMLMIVLGFIKYLLMPLRDIANKMRDYRPGKHIDFNIIEHENEIGMIVSAFRNMQKNIDDYSSQLNSTNQNLEQKVEDKTAELRYAYYYDALTKLPNRNKLREILKLNNNVLVILNIDDFKEVNDFYGFVAGDEILAGVGGWLASCGYDAYRLSGDEFAILFDAKMDKNWLIEHIDKLHEELHSTFFVHGDEYVQLNATLGVCFESEDMLGKADIALHTAKHNKEAIGIYSKELHVEAKYEHNINMTKIIKNALDDGRVIAHYQPIMDLKSGMITKYETLVRIVDNNGKILMPNDFLPIAQKGRFYPELTKRVVQLACGLFEERSEQFSVNISMADIMAPDTVDFILNCVKTTNVGERIIFEMLESEGIEELAEVAKFISEVKKLGAKIAIDDFGTGYSNFEHILKLKVDYLKIDGSLIRNINARSDARVIVDTIVGFAHKLDISVVAEYVCAEDIFNTVKELDIEYAQGYHVGKPALLAA